ncbi:cupin domain-containing protein [Dyadobacter arcticus]|uniref:Quercetin 2,3-dioxygenase n=1 Tax=Dyadobacter arcticus TaxID=1078754 RepID=A0ABX0USF7_9BACT|nr:cupin domain-containing protein [Dyadobacter arcticus]NIJ54590.1 quercetin 2,3-dioxygenase [Dyadobacter arcticus]
MVSTVALTTVGTSSHSQTTSKAPEKGFLIKAGETRFGERTPFRVVNANDLKVSSKDTAGSVSVFEYVGKEKMGPPLHIHFNQDEIFYVVEGEYLFQVGSEKMMVKVGDTIFGPRNVPHTWIQMSDTGKLVYLVQPSGTMEQFFSELNQLKGPPSEDQIQKIHMEHGMKVLGPPLSLK